MKAALGLVLGLALVGCSDGGEGSGDDALPKRGENTSDPTIVAATATCSDGEISIPGQPPATPNLAVRVAASDAAGQENLGNCIGETSTSSDQGSFGSGSAGTCYLEFSLACTVGKTYVVDLTVSNARGGVTTASVSVRAD